MSFPRSLAGLALAGAAACLPVDEPDPVGEEPTPYELPPLDDLPWPPPPDPGESCARADFELPAPDVAAAVGLVHLGLSSGLLPVGVSERMDVEVRRIGTGEVDVDFDGAVQLEPPPGVTLEGALEATAGELSVGVVFETPGLHRLESRVADGRTGTVEVYAYESELPRWDLEVDEAEFAAMVAAPDDGIRVAGTLAIDGVDYPTTLRIHGGTSRAFPKKSLRFDLDPGSVLPTGQNHLVLRAEWNDKTMLRNHLGMQLFRDATSLPTPATEPVHFRIGGRFYGLMWWVERIDGDFLRRRGLADGSMYEGEPEDDFFAFDAFAPLDDPADYRQVYMHKKGDEDYAGLIHLIEDVLTTDSADFLEVLLATVDVDSYLVYLAAMAALQNQDHVKKNFYLRRDPAASDDRWVFYPWDVDLGFGHLWSAEESTTSEEMFTDGDPHHGLCPGFCSRLMTRVWEEPELGERYEAMVRRVLRDYLTEELVSARARDFLCRADWDLAADVRKRSTAEEYPGRVDELIDFVRARSELLSGEWE